MLMSISTGSLAPLPLRTIFRVCAEAGCDGLELVATGLTGMRDGRRLYAMEREFRLPVRTVHQTLVHHQPRGPWCDWILTAVDLALRTEARTVVVHGPDCFHWEQPKAQNWLRTIEISQRRLEGSGVRLALENNNHHHAYDSRKLLAGLPELAAFARQHDLDVTFDTCHAVAAGVDVLTGWGMVANLTSNIHLSDLVPRPVPGNSPLLRSLISDHQLPGSGILPLAELGRILAAESYSGVVTLEVSPLALPTYSTSALRRKLEMVIRFAK